MLFFHLPSCCHHATLFFVEQQQMKISIDLIKGIIHQKFQQLDETHTLCVDCSIHHQLQPINTSNIYWYQTMFFKQSIYASNPVYSHFMMIMVIIMLWTRNANIRKYNSFHRVSILDARTVVVDKMLML